MNIEELRDYCLSLPLVTEYMPFKEEYLIFRVYEKWIAVIPMQELELSISVKCEPTYALDLRERYQGINAAWHFNKKYWNNIKLNEDVSTDLVQQLIRHSIDEVVSKLPKKTRLEYEELKNW